MPNLEQTGQLLLTYAGVDELAADETEMGDRWASHWPAPTRQRAAQIMQTLLDEMRRNICIESEYLTEERYEDIKRASAAVAPRAMDAHRRAGRLRRHLLSRRRARRAARGFGGDLYISGLGQYGRWLRRQDRFPLHDHPLKADRRRRRHRRPARR